MKNRITPRFDSIILASGDPVASQYNLLNDYGLTVTQGPDLAGGLSCLIAPMLNNQYLRIVYIKDLSEAYKSPFGTWLWHHGLSRNRDVLIGWTVELDDLLSASASLEIPITENLVRYSESVSSSWNTLADPSGFSGLPILIQYNSNDPSELAGIEPNDAEILSIVTGAKKEDVHLWLGDASDLSIQFTAKSIGMHSANLRIGNRLCRYS